MPTGPLTAAGGVATARGSKARGGFPLAAGVIPGNGIGILPASVITGIAGAGVRAVVGVMLGGLNRGVRSGTGGAAGGAVRLRGLTGGIITMGVGVAGVAGMGCGAAGVAVGATGGVGKGKGARPAGLIAGMAGMAGDDERGETTGAGEATGAGREAIGAAGGCTGSGIFPAGLIVGSMGVAKRGEATGATGITVGVVDDGGEATVGGFTTARAEVAADGRGKGARPAGLIVGITGGVAAGRDGGGVTAGIAGGFATDGEATGGTTAGAIGGGTLSAGGRTLPGAACWFTTTGGVGNRGIRPAGLIAGNEGVAGRAEGATGTGAGGNSGIRPAGLITGSVGGDVRGVATGAGTTGDVIAGVSLRSLACGGTTGAACGV